MKPLHHQYTVANALISLAMAVVVLHVTEAQSLTADRAANDIDGKLEKSVPTKTERSVSVTLRARLSSGAPDVSRDGSAVRLAVRGVSVEGNPDVVGFKVFLNKQDAGHDTPSSDPHYVGAFAFGELSNRHSESVNLDATRAFKHLKVMDAGTLHKNFTATLVPIWESTSEANHKVVILASDAELQILPANKLESKTR